MGVLLAVVCCGEDAEHCDHWPPSMRCRRNNNNETRPLFFFPTRVTAFKGGSERGYALSEEPRAGEGVSDPSGARTGAQVSASGKPFLFCLLRSPSLERSVRQAAGG